MPLEGQQLGRYHLLRLLGSGGMGEVYLAEDPRIEQQVAIKVLRAEASAYPNLEATREASRLFLREVKAIAKLDHPNILPLFDYGEATINGATLAYMVMPYRSEGSLTNWLHQRGSGQLLPPEDVAHFIRQAADALQDAHDHQILHQDVKPANFLIRTNKDHPTRPDLQLADFGIAKFSNLATTNTSRTIRGTPAYMSPEQWSGHPVLASDQYALAVMAYELLAGRQPFQGSFEQVMYQHFNTEPLPPSRLNPNLPPDVDAVFQVALAKQPEQRFASVSAFARALQQALLRRSAYNEPTYINTPPPAGRAIDPPRVEQTIPAHVPPRRDEELEGHREGLPKGITILLVVLAILVGGGAVAFLYPLLTGKNSTSTSQTPATTATAAGTSQTTPLATNPATNSKNPYPPFTGNLVLNDPLVDNSRGYNWDSGISGSTKFGTCNFIAGAYYVKAIQNGAYHYCAARQTDFSNFAYEVELTINSGDCGGIIFRADFTNFNYYYFSICQNGSYELFIFRGQQNSTPLRQSSFNPAIKTGLGQFNLIAVVANGSALNLYVNNSQIDSVIDTTYSQGQIGVLAANDVSNPTEVVFTNARVWTF